MRVLYKSIYSNIYTYYTLYPTLLSLTTKQPSLLNLYLTALYLSYFILFFFFQHVYLLSLLLSLSLLLVLLFPTLYICYLSYLLPICISAISPTCTSFSNIVYLLSLLSSSNLYICYLSYLYFFFPTLYICYLSYLLPNIVYLLFSPILSLLLTCISAISPIFFQHRYPAIFFLIFQYGYLLSLLSYNFLALPCPYD